jgi:hypothetical protein
MDSRTLTVALSMHSRHWAISGQVRLIHAAFEKVQSKEKMTMHSLRADQFEASFVGRLVAE